MRTYITNVESGGPGIMTLMGIACIFSYLWPIRRIHNSVGVSKAIHFSDLCPYTHTISLLQQEQCRCCEVYAAPASNGASPLKHMLHAM